MAVVDSWLSGAVEAVRLLLFLAMLKRFMATVVHHGGDCCNGGDGGDDAAGSRNGSGGGGGGDGGGDDRHGEDVGRVNGDAVAVVLLEVVVIMLSWR